MLLGNLNGIILYKRFYFLSSLGAKYLGSDSGIGFDPVQELYNAGEAMRDSRRTAGTSHERGNAVDLAVLVHGAASVSLGETIN